ncbi:MAG TPA: VapC toxin family PIN domain ribonuclease [Desulfobacteraceae bacterium]|nr:VapC toxin family PIN domain ribonuclease [Desulfobacteraceae bacterium]
MSIPDSNFLPIETGQFISENLGKREKANREELNCFLNSERVKLFSVNQDTAECYSKIYQNLRQKGRPIPTNDMWIAAIALQHELPIFSYDSHFEYVDGVISGSCLSDFIMSESGLTRF